MNYNEAQEEFINRIRLSPDRKWINTYLNIIRQLIVGLDLRNDDPRLAITIPQPSKKWDLPFIPVSINYRYILAPDLIENRLAISFVYSSEFEKLEQLPPEIINKGKFKPHLNENEDTVPYWLCMDIENFLAKETIKLGWLNRLITELGLAKGSKYRKSHKPIVFDAAVYLDFRAMLLEKAFPNR